MDTTLLDCTNNPHLIEELFQSLFIETDSDVNSITTNCKHKNIHKDNSGVTVCNQCGLEFETLDFQQEWRWYGASDNKTSRDPSRCDTTPKRARNSIRPVFHNHNVDISPAMMDMVQARFNHIIEIEGKVIRCKGRKAIVAACLFHVYRDMGECRTISYIRKLFQVKQRNMTFGMTKYLKAFPEARTQHTTTEEFIPWVMKQTSVDRKHYRQILAITRYTEAASELLKRSNPKSVAAAIVFFYLCLKYKKKLGITKALFAKKARISDVTLTNIVREIASISRVTIVM